MDRNVKVVLLGASESGKSTILKQMRILFQKGYSQKERMEFLPTIYMNTIQCICTILNAMGELGMTFAEKERLHDGRQLYALAPLRDDGHWITELSGIVKRLWADTKLQECFARANEYSLNDSAEYFLNSLERLTADDYVPTLTDVLKMRMSTARTTECNFKLNGFNFSMLDIGSQVTEQARWLDHIVGCNSIIFVVALSEYDQTTNDEHQMNRLAANLSLFGLTCTNPLFRHVSMILFLNKKDLMEKKLKSTPLTVAFPEYEGSETYEESSQYILGLFEADNHRDPVTNHPSKRVYAHLTCAIESHNILKVFDNVADVIVSSQMQSITLF